MGSTSASVDVVLADDSDVPDINITVESIFYTYTKQPETPNFYPTLSPDERKEFYDKYDPMTGLRIAVTLSGFFTLAVLYVIYKAKCKRVKWMRGSSFEDSLDPVSVTSQRDQFCQNGDPEEHSNKHSIQHLSESGRDTPVSRASASTKLHYYADDSEMPAWKIYAKDLFLYGGSGLWRSASLKGSDPVLLMQDESINRSRSQLRTGSLSGSVMGALGNNSRWNKRKLSEVGSNSSHSRLRAATTQTAASSQQQTLIRAGTSARSVSFREGS